jgi:hypothetical protein
MKPKYRFAVVGLSILIGLIVGTFGKFSPNRQKATSARSEAQILMAIPQSIDFGEVVQGDLAKAMVTITNVSGEKQSFSIMKSCGCTSAEPEETNLPQGTSTRLNVAVNTALKSGAFQESVYLSVSGSSNEKLVVPISGRAKRIVELAPSMVTFGEVRHRSEAFRQVTLRSLNGQPLLVKYLTTWTNSVSAEIFDESESQAVVIVSIPVEAKTGEIRDFVRVHLISPIERTEDIPVTGFYTGELSGEPSELSWDQLTDENWREMLLEAKIQQIDGKQFAVKKVSGSDNRFSASVEPLGQVDSEGRADSFLLKVALSKPLGEADAQTVVIIEGDTSEDARLEIPIHVARQH